MGKRTLKIFIYSFVFLILALIVYAVTLTYRYQKYRTAEISINVDLPKLSAYTIAKSYLQGDSINIYIHSEDDYIGEIFRFGSKKLEKITEFSGAVFEQSRRYSLKFGHSWEVSKTVSTKKWPSGFYIIRLRLKNNKEVKFTLPILIRSKISDKIVVVSPTNTWQAYNNYGGKSNYRDSVTPRDLKMLFKWLSEFSPTLSPYTYLPKKRPLSHELAISKGTSALSMLNGKISSDLYLIEFLESKGISYDIISDEDFEKGVGLKNARIIIFNNHSEYWSFEGIGMLNHYINEGVNIAFLSGNNMYRRIESLNEDALLVMDQQLSRSTIEPILGTFYSESGYNSLGSFLVVKEDHWIFDNTKLKNGESFGKNVISGIETDKKGPFSDGFTLLAIGDNKYGPAHMVIKEFPKGNFLFNSSSISSVRALDVDHSWSIIVQNIIEKGLINVDDHR